MTVNVLLMGYAQQAAEQWIRGLHTQLPGLDWWGTNGMQLLRVTDWNSGNILYHRNQFSNQARLTCAECWPSVSTDMEVHFITPLVSKHHYNDPLMAALKTRIQRLRNQFGDGVRFERANEYWQCQIKSKRSLNLILSQNERRLACHYYSLKLAKISVEGAELLGAGLWLHAGGQTGLGLGRYCIEIK